MGKTPRTRIYFPAGDYLFNNTVGPFPSGALIRGDGVSSALLPDGPGGSGNPGYSVAALLRPNYGVSATRLLCKGVIGVQMGHPPSQMMGWDSAKPAAAARSLST